MIMTNRTQYKPENYKMAIAVLTSVGLAQYCLNLS